MGSAFFADSGPAIHIAPGPVLHWGVLTVTNSMLYGWACVALLLIVLILLARQVTVRPKRGVIQLVEVVTEFMLQTVESGFEDKARARKYAPYFVTLFFFILLNNWLGLVPGVGEALTVGGVPLLRPFTGDLNGTLAAAVITMAFVYISSVREAGSFGAYLRHFFVGSPRNPLYFVIGLLEMVTDLTRVLSLALRLFLNIAIGEIVIAVFSYLGSFAAPLTAAPFTFIELFVGALQAYIFATLGAMYLAATVNEVTDASTETTATIPQALTVDGSHA